MDIDWILDENISASKMGNVYLVIERKRKGRICIIRYANGRMLFNGEDIETEAYMAYVGLIDEIEKLSGGLSYKAIEFDKEL